MRSYRKSQTAGGACAKLDDPLSQGVSLGRTEQTGDSISGSAEGVTTARGLKRESSSQLSQFKKALASCGTRIGHER